MLGGLFSQFCIERIQILDAVAFSLLVLYNKKGENRKELQGFGIVRTGRIPDGRAISGASAASGKEDGNL